MAAKIIVIGSVKGQLHESFRKLTTLHTKNNFSFAIIVGDLFAEDDDTVSDLLANKISIPLPTYFAIGENPLPQRVINKLSKDEDLCDNLHYLSKRSTTKTSDGIRIVTLGGRLDNNIASGLSNEQFVPFHTIDDAKALRGANTTDILLTTCWPASIRTGSKVPLPEGAAEPTSYEHISDLSGHLKPRYHFSTSSQLFYEREPFYHRTTEASESKPVTRFISLAAYNNSLKQKALYAMSLQSTVESAVPLPAGTTPSPFIALVHGRKRPALDPNPYTRFSNSDDLTYQKSRKSKRVKQPPPGPGECFFCLSNPNLATHLVASIGEDAYVTTAKGPLTTATTNSRLGISFPGHTLIIPLTHSPSLALIPDQDCRTKTYTEMNNYKIAMQSMVAASSSNKLGAVTYEVCRTTGIHTHWQFLPIPTALIQKGLVEAAFRVEAENMKYPIFQTRDPGIGESDADFFRVWIWSPPDEDFKDGSTQCLTLPLDDSFRFDLQFGRRVLAKLLGLEKRIQWRDCSQTEDEEKKDVEAFKVAFKEFDFSL